MKMKKRCFCILGLIILVLSINVMAVQAAPVYFSETGHYYDFIAGSFTWNAAKADAEARLYNGAYGYLATLTSLNEDVFIRANFSNQVGQFVGPWFGASWDGSAYGATGGWHWVTGEAFSYTGWNGGEPNHLYGENAIHFSYGGWNDIHNSRTDSIGYLIEYNAGSSPVPEPSTILLLGFGLAGVAVARRKFKK